MKGVALAIMGMTLVLGVELGRISGTIPKEPNAGLAILEGLWFLLTLVVVAFEL